MIPLLASSNGQVLLASGLNNMSIWCLLRSADGGLTWTDVSPSGVSGFEQYIMSADGQKIVLKGGPSGTGNTLITSSDGGTTWATRTISNQSMGCYLLSRQGNTLVFRGDSASAPVSVCSGSGNLGQSWTTLWTTIAIEQPFDSMGRKKLACDASGLQIAFARNSMAGGMTESTRYGIYLSAGDKVTLGQASSTAEFIYRGNGRWSVIAPTGATTSIGQP